MNNSKVKILALLVLFAILFFLGFQQQGKVELEGFGVSLKMGGSNSPEPGVKGKDLESHRNIQAEDKAGRGVAMEKAKADRDIILTNDTPPGGAPRPKQ